MIHPEIKLFSDFIIKNHNQISVVDFSQELMKVQKSYCHNTNEYDEFCKEAEVLATNLVSNKNLDFAGIIMSSLCKIVEFIPDKLEGFALKGYEIAKSNGDYIHMMARLNNLRKIYYGNHNKLGDYVNVLYKQEKCLKELTNHYDTATENYHSIIRKPASKRDYSIMLAHVQTEIGKLTKKRYPQDAKAKLLSARKTFEKEKNYQSVNYIDMLLNEIEEMLSVKDC